MLFTSMFVKNVSETDEKEQLEKQLCFKRKIIGGLNWGFIAEGGVRGRQ